MLFCRTGELHGKFGLKESGEKPSGNDFLKNIIQDHDYIVDDYRDPFHSWEYIITEVVINALLEHTDIFPDENPTMLYVSCGDGLCRQYSKC